MISGRGMAGPLVSKRASGAEIRKLVATIESGARPESSATHRYQPPQRGVPIIDRLMVRTGDIPIWRALATQSDRNAIAEVTNVSRSKVDSFLSEHFDVVAEIEKELLFRAPPEPFAETRAPVTSPTGTRRADHNAPLSQRTRAASARPRHPLCGDGASRLRISGRGHLIFGPPA